ncbi:LysE family transporter [Limnohabitans sp.]|uniref:LysE family transporter n=1 Tax=Limnohabitans sp. TaxID=1907725 RepID=UPI0025BC642C|nr:LysE family transporter [Limnohabitans sp.]
MIASHATFLLSVATLYILLAISPGPNFLVITQAAISRSRSQALCIALGVSTASVIWASLAALGLGIFLSQFMWLQRTLQVLGGCYLLYVGVKMLLKARTPLDVGASVVAEVSDWQAYRSGLLTNLANPKTLMFFTSVFASLFSGDLTANVKLAAIFVVAAISIAWNVLTVTIFAMEKSRRVYAHGKVWIDTVIGAFITFFSLKLIANL